MKGYEDFLTTKDNFLYVSEFSWELKSLQIYQNQMPEVTEQVDEIFKLIDTLEY